MYKEVSKTKIERSDLETRPGIGTRKTDSGALPAPVVHHAYIII